MTICRWSLHVQGWWLALRWCVGGDRLIWTHRLVTVAVRIICYNQPTVCSSWTNGVDICANTSQANSCQSRKHIACPQSMLHRQRTPGVHVVPPIWGHIDHNHLATANEWVVVTQIRSHPLSFRSRPIHPGRLNVCAHRPRAVIRISEAIRPGRPCDCGCVCYLWVIYYSDLDRPESGFLLFALGESPLTHPSRIRRGQRQCIWTYTYKCRHWGLTTQCRTSTWLYDSSGERGDESYTLEYQPEVLVNSGKFNMIQFVQDELDWVVFHSSRWVLYTRSAGCAPFVLDELFMDWDPAKKEWSTWNSNARRPSWTNGHCVRLSPIFLDTGGLPVAHYSSWTNGVQIESPSKYAPLFTSRIILVTQV